MPVRKLRKPPTPLDAGELLAYAARILSARAQTTSELREKLRKKAAQRDDVDEVLTKLKELGYINDQRFAESFATWQRDNQGLGKTRVVRDLMARRVAPVVAKQAAEDAFREADELAMIQSFLDRKFRGKNLATMLSYRNPDHDKNLASAFRKLRTAGFSTGNSIRVLKKYSSEADRLEEMQTEEADERAAE
ncbi:MAG: RecX family transcriptional regulator [Bryobacteraceae bacterium]